MAKKYNLIETIIPYYEYEPKSVLENNQAKLYWDRLIMTDKTVNANRPDIVLILQTEKIAFFIDITHPADHNLIKAEAEKISKYTNLAIEFQDIYKLKSVETIPIVVSANGLIGKNLAKFITKLDLPPDSVSARIRKSVILETCRIARKIHNIRE